MFDFPVRPGQDAHLLALLSHYARLGSEDRTVWQDRLMRMDGVKSEQLTVLHGELIAFDWIEQNTGGARLLSDGTLSACYRITRHGLGEFRRLHDLEEPSEPTEPAPQRLARKKKGRSEAADVTALE
ncbi:hypothetical protein [Frigoriglobus tundricola]|uniref:Uncharacterized protein n=1 Tax=Frigoriglobus tundricola TaxID=2774151 RepID=A0A6M5Z668_9BACT|nr:hypothetical protein [Frigoriglobus tundricola]QJX01357.1 hypothetical protein FTUN_9001 [Frigoriglobus tundricola]